MAAGREDHRHAGGVASGYDLFVALGAARLDYRLHAGGYAGLGAVGEGEEGVRGHRGTVERSARLLDGEAHRVDAAHLPRADAYRREVLGKHDRVRAHVLAHLPREEQLAPLRLARLALGDDAHVLAHLD